MSTNVILYNYFRSSASYRVRLALAYKKITYEYRSVHLLQNGGEQLNENYRELNPAKEVPTLVHDGFVLAQSLPILQYLDDVFMGPHLFPRDPKKRGLVLQFCENINAGIQPLQNLRVLKYLGSEFGLSESARAKWARYWITQNFEVLEKFVERTAGTYCLGDQMTAADFFFLPQVVTAKRFEVELSDYPLLRRIYATLENDQTLAEAHPSRQPDYQIS